MQPRQEKIDLLKIARDKTTAIEKLLEIARRTDIENKNIFLALAVILPLLLNLAVSGPGQTGCTVKTTGSFWSIMI